MQTIPDKLHISYLQNQKPYLFRFFFYSAMCILLNNHKHSRVCKYINVCLINDYVVLFFEQIKMLYILCYEFSPDFFHRKYGQS